jgi:uncharacterized membrane protein YfcA
VGGGGLVLLPALMHAFPTRSLATVFGTNKIIAMAGTVSSAFAYFKKGLSIGNLSCRPCWQHLYFHSSVRCLFP